MTFEAPTQTINATTTKATFTHHPSDIIELAENK